MKKGKNRWKDIHKILRISLKEMPLGCDHPVGTKFRRFNQKSSRRVRGTWKDIIRRVRADKEANSIEVPKQGKGKKVQ